LLRLLLPLCSEELGEFLAEQRDSNIVSAGSTRDDSFGIEVRRGLSGMNV